MGLDQKKITLESPASIELNDLLHESIVLGLLLFALLLTIWISTVAESSTRRVSDFCYLGNGS